MYIYITICLYVHIYLNIYLIYAHIYLTLSLDDKSEAKEPAPSPSPAGKKHRQGKETPQASKASSIANTSKEPDEGDEDDPSSKMKRDLKRKRRSMTQHKKVLRKKDKILPKVVPKNELSVTETAFLSRLVSRTRSWINEVIPGMHINTSTHPNAPTFVPNINTSHDKILPHLKTPSRGDATNSFFLQLGSKGRSPGPYQAPYRQVPRPKTRKRNLLQA